ncbi:MAG: hypothetical protein ACREKN_05005 [Longimicrobiaceae bacterium]
MSAVLVFAASAAIHMALGYHRNDLRELPNEDEVAEALRRGGAKPGDYAMPHAAGMEAMKDPSYLERLARGPVGFLTLAAGGPPSMGKTLMQWFVYCLVVTVFAAYVVGRAVGPAAPFSEVFRFSATVAFVGYALALWQDSIWYKRAWSTTLKNSFDGVVYAALTGTAFGWLWVG